MEPMQFTIEGIAGIHKTAFKCALLGAVVAVGAFLIRKDGQSILVDNINVEMQRLSCTRPEPIE